jgi:hypothetical protein
MYTNTICVPSFPSQEDYDALTKLLPPEESATALPYSEVAAFFEKLDRTFPPGSPGPVRVEVKPAAVKAWCEANGQPVCRASIVQYVESKSKEKLGMEPG